MNSKQDDYRASREQLSRDLAKAREEIERLRERRIDLETLCAVAYQYVGATDGPVELLDNLDAAASGDPLPHDSYTLLPFTPGTGLEQQK